MYSLLYEKFPVEYIITLKYYVALQRIFYEWKRLCLIVK